MIQGVTYREERYQGILFLSINLLYRLLFSCSVLQCILYLTARYQSDLEGKEAIKMAERFYFEAAQINPDIGNKIIL